MYTAFVQENNFLHFDSLTISAKGCALLRFLWQLREFLWQTRSSDSVLNFARDRFAPAWRIATQSTVDRQDA